MRLCLPIGTPITGELPFVGDIVFALEAFDEPAPIILAADIFHLVESAAGGDTQAPSVPGGLDVEEI
jgi:hypothetical protein